MTDVKIIFSYNGENEEIECKKDEFMLNIYKRYVMKIKVDLNKLYFLCNGSMINPEKKLEEIIQRDEKIINMIVYDLYDDENNEIILKQSKDIICPICNEICLINLNDYKITFSNCRNGHRFTKIMFDEFMDFQKIDESKIICDKCIGEDKNKKSEVSNNLFFNCLTCNINLCPLCKGKHDKMHLIINYNIKNYNCNIHGERYISYCKECNKDICDNCRYDDKHYSSYHKVSFLYELVKRKENIMNELRMKIDDLTKAISKKTTIINKVFKNYEEYYNVVNNIINSIERKNMNFYILNNINNIIEYNEKIIKDIDIILNEKDEENKNKYLSEIYQKMIIDNEFILKYKLGEVGILRIFGEPFVAKNKKNFNLIINGENYELSSTIKIIDIENGESSNKILKSKKYYEADIEIINEGPEIRMKIEEALEIRLRQIKTIKDISYMFSGCTRLENIEYSNLDTNNIVNMASLFNECELLTSLPDISKWNTSNVSIMNNIFSKCYSLSSLPDISKWNTNNVTDMSFIFYYCSSLISLPDISKWNTINVINMKGIFYGCSSLNSLPDISKWNTNNVNNMNGLFSYCESLISLPDISKWNTNNVTDMNSIFGRCFSLTSLPDISKWNTNNVNNMSFIFYDCESLISLPDISKWNINNATNMSFIFYYCSSLTSLPDISKWNTNNVTHISFLFSGCSSLNSLPDISNWNTNNVTYMSSIFNGCSSLTSLPDISKWNTNKVTDMSFAFSGCSSLNSLPDISNWNTNNVTHMNSIFNGCKSLISLPDISNWNTNNVTNMSKIFYYCESLKSLPDISKWNTNNVTDKSNIFDGCTSLNSLPDIFN